MLKTMKNVKPLVLEILEKYPETRDNDILLYFKFLDIQHGLSEKLGATVFFMLTSIAQKAPFPESIRRTRQKIQEGGLFVGNKRARRIESEKEVRENIHTL